MVLCPMSSGLAVVQTLKQGAPAVSAVLAARAGSGVGRGQAAARRRREGGLLAAQRKAVGPVAHPLPAGRSSTTSSSRR